jgi:hypothetical protein
MVHDKHVIKQCRWNDVNSRDGFRVHSILLALSNPHNPESNVLANGVVAAETERSRSDRLMKRNE